jgi:hypothetical protein
VFFALNKKKPDFKLFVAEDENIIFLDWNQVGVCPTLSNQKNPPK